MDEGEGDGAIVMVDLLVVTSRPPAKDFPITGIMIFCGTVTVWMTAALAAFTVSRSPMPDFGSSSSKWDRLRELMLAVLLLRLIAPTEGPLTTINSPAWIASSFPPDRLLEWMIFGDWILCGENG